MKKYLIVVAHPDDEILGAGATIFDLVRKGSQVAVCCLCSQCDTRYDNLLEGMKKSYDILGVSKFFLGKWGCLKLKDADHLELVQFVESAITQFQPDVMITHHPSDLNNDHYIASIICHEAARLPQRNLGYTKRIESILAMEVPSETDWHFNPAWDAFKPNTYQGVTSEAIEAKIKALSVYQDVVRPAPHPRSPETLRALATVRGSEAGSLYAEAFQCIFRLGV